MHLLAQRSPGAFLATRVFVHWHTLACFEQKGGPTVDFEALHCSEPTSGLVTGSGIPFVVLVFALVIYPEAEDFWRY